MAQNVLTISQLNEYIRSKLDSDNLLNQVAVKGEISNTMYYNGKVPRYYSAGSPEMRESLYNAVQKILENQ